MARLMGKSEMLSYPTAYTPEARHDACFFDEKVKVFVHRNYAQMHVERLKIQCLFLGDAGVGKSTMIDKYTRDDFRVNRRPTNGVVATKHEFKILGFPFEVSFLDAAGVIKPDAIAPKDFKDIQSIVLVYDMSDTRTLESLKVWYDEVIHASLHEEHDPHPLIFVVGTKKDLVSREAVEQIEAQAIAFANRINAEYWSVRSRDYDDSLVSTAASLDDGLNELFLRLAALSFEEAVHRQYKQEIITEWNREYGATPRPKSRLARLSRKVRQCCTKLLKFTKCKKCTFNPAR